MDNKMRTNIYTTILSNKAKNKKMFALLIDPEKHTEISLRNICKLAQENRPDFIFIGGSQIIGSIDNALKIIKQETDLPIILFPSHFSQLSSSVECLLFLSLTSGRNPKFLIEQQISSAKYIRQHNIEAISTSYILIDGGKSSAVEQVSNTTPYNPKSDKELIVDTAIASELIGFQLIYLEAGSGAKHPVSKEIIEQVTQNTKTPIIVGGGITNIDGFQNALSGGADIVVIGNHLELFPEQLSDFTNFINLYNKKNEK